MDLDELQGLDSEFRDALDIVLDPSEKRELVSFYEEEGVEGFESREVSEILDLDSWKRVKLARLLVTNPRVMKAKNRLMEKYPERFDDAKEKVSEDLDLEDE